MGGEKRAISEFRLDQAHKVYIGAKLLYDNNLFSQSINRSYYSIFHTVKALLAYEKKDSQKHSGVIFLFYDIFIKTDKIEKEYNRILVTAEKIRIDTDYKTFYLVSKEETKTQLDNSLIFYERIKNILKKII